MEISKELLSEVLGYTEDDYEILAGEKPIYIKDNYLYYEYQDPYCSVETYITIKNSINIYELAFKYKEWVLSKGYYFSIYSFNFSANTEQEHRVRLLIGNDVVYWGNDSCEETEVEAIILASEWVLKEINEKQLQH